MKSEKELKTEVRRIRERARELSGFWISELAAAAYALEWVIEKRPAPPSADIGRPDSDHGKIAASLTKAASDAMEKGKGAKAQRAAGPRRLQPAKPARRR